METKCEKCKFANRSGSKDFVYCGYWQRQANESKQEPEAFVRNVMHLNPRPQVVALGWGFPHQPYEGDVAWHHKGTATAGLMWNEQICVSKEDFCNEFRVR